MKKLLCIAAICASTTALPVYADDVTDAISEATTAYNDKDFGEAISQLTYATQLVYQMKGDYLASILPDAPAGWKAEEVKNNSQASIMGGGTQVSRQYTKEEGRGSFRLEIIADSPMVQSVLAVYNNPMMITASGARMKKINGHKAFVKMQRNNAEITLVIGSALVKGTGRNITEEEAMALFTAVPFDNIK